jgi:hypothetical protein
MTNRELDAEIGNLLFGGRTANYTLMPMMAHEVLDKCIARAKEMDWDEHTYAVCLNLRPGECAIYLLDQYFMEQKHTVEFDGIHDLPRAICMFALKFWGKKV